MVLRAAQMAVLRDGFQFRKTDMQESVVHDSVEAVLAQHRVELAGRVERNRDEHRGAVMRRRAPRLPAMALPGAVLGPDFKIKVGKLRGVESQGMMCSAEGRGERCVHGTRHRVRAGARFWGVAWDAAAATMVRRSIVESRERVKSGTLAFVVS